MKILVLPSWYPPFGGYFKQRQNEALSEKGHDVFVITNEYKSLKDFKIQYLFKNNKTTVHDENGLTVLRNKYWKLPKSEKLNTILWTKSTLKMFEFFLKKYGKPDIIQAHCSIWAGNIAFHIKQKYGIPYVITENRARYTGFTHFAKDRFKDWYFPFLNKIFKNASVIIPVSKILIPKISEYLPDEKPEFKIIPNMVTTDFFTLRPDKKSKNFVFFIVAILNPVKGIDLLLPAFKKVAEKYPEVLLRIGGDGALKKPLEKLAEELEISDKVTFTGKLSREEVKDEMHNADCFVLSSRAEAAPLVLTEATSTGLPVVCTNVVSDDLISAETGIIVEAENSEALEKGMLQIIENYENYDKNKIRKFAMENFDKSKVADKILNVMKKIISENQK